MNNLVLQPKASRLAQDHFTNTVINGIKKEDVYAVIDDRNISQIERLNLGDRFRIWGVMDNNTSKFEKLQKDDLVLFTANNLVEAYRKIAYTFSSLSLARYLWGQDKFETWSNIYLIKDFHLASNIPIKTVNKALGYQENNTIQGFTVIDNKTKINSFLRNFHYSNGTISIKDPKKTTDALSTILKLLHEEDGLTLEAIQDKTKLAKSQLEPILKGGVIGKLFTYESGKYRLHK